uniref:Uncharacterized protein n=1 Tax=Helianthus annuus TaxID=4232 RepID=A0A251S9J2_HELAN
MEVFYFMTLETEDGSSPTPFENLLSPNKTRHSDYVQGRQLVAITAPTFVIGTISESLRSSTEHLKSSFPNSPLKRTIIYNYITMPAYGCSIEKSYDHNAEPEAADLLMEGCMLMKSFDFHHTEPPPNDYVAEVSPSNLSMRVGQSIRDTFARFPF